MTDEEHAKKLEEFKADVVRDADLGQEQRDAANEDTRFINVIGGMWENFLEDDFEDRVKLELDLVSNFRNRFIGQWNQNRVGVEYKPDDSKTTDDEAELLNGIYRHDFRKGSGKLSTDNAVDEAATCGVGALKIATEFEDDSDPENDNMNAVWRPIYNAYATVIWDAAAKRIDKRDANHCTELAQFTDKSFERQYPDAQPVSAYTPPSRSFMNNGNSTTADIFIATRYEIKKHKVDVFVYNNLRSGKVVWFSKEDHEKVKDDLAKDEFHTFVRKRKIIEQIVEKTVFSGEEILENTRRIAGKWIPIIPFYAYRSYVDGVETYRGLVRKLKDPARLFNMQVSQLAENAATGGQEVPIFTPEQMENEDVKALWADKNNQPYLLVDPVRDGEGNVISAGPIGYSKPAMLDQSTTTLLGIVPQFVQDSTGGAPQESFSSDMSGKAIKAIIKRQDMNTQPVNDNIAGAIAWSGTVYQSIASEIYVNKRMVRTIGKDGAESEVQLLEQVLDEKTGDIIEANNLSDSRFQAYADVGPQYDTIAEQTVEDLKGMLEALGQTPGGEQYLPALIAVLMDNITGVGLDPIKDLNRKIMLTSGLVKPATPEEEVLVQQAQQPKEDPNAALVKAAAAQQEAEARSLDASSVQKTADAGKKVAETEQIRVETGLSQVEVLNKRADDVREQAATGLVQ